MKRVHKNILGLSGLALVAGITACAALMPSPGASAVTAGSVTDTLVIKVVGSQPDVNLSSPLGDEAEITDPVYQYNVSYEHALSVTLTLTYRDQNYETTQQTHTKTLEYWGDLNYEYGEWLNQVLNLEGLVFNDGTPAGFGEYTLKATSTGVDGTDYFDVLNFSYLPVVGGEFGPDENGDPSIKVDKVSSKVNKLVVKNAEGEIVGSLTDTDGFSSEKYANGIYVPLDFTKIKCSDKLYLYAYHIYDDGTEEELYSHPYPIDMAECIDVPQAGAPDTGGLFQNLNISNEDYLITGLIVFFVLGIVGFGVVARNRKAAAPRKRR